LRIATSYSTFRMTDILVNTVTQIDNYIRQNNWFDFHVISYDGYNLTIAGGIDLTYYHSLEIIFEDVFFFSGFFQGWHSNTQTSVFLIPDNIIELNQKYEIEQGFNLFKFVTEDYKENVIIAAKKISFKMDTVYYYERNELKENERIADFVKKKND
jgi:hypothetical protein